MGTALDKSDPALQDHSGQRCSSFADSSDAVDGSGERTLAELAIPRLARTAESSERSLTKFAVSHIDPTFEAGPGFVSAALYRSTTAETSFGNESRCPSLDRPPPPPELRRDRTGRRVNGARPSSPTVRGRRLGRVLRHGHVSREQLPGRRFDVSLAWSRRATCPSVPVDRVPFAEVLDGGGDLFVDAFVVGVV